MAEVLVPIGQFFFANGLQLIVCALLLAAAVIVGAVARDQER